MVFISHAQEDFATAAVLIEELESSGYATWHYSRDSVPGVSHLRQTARAIEMCGAAIVIVSSQSLDSAQVTSELVRAHEIGKPIVPLLLELSHAELQSLRPDWSQAFGASASLTVPRGGILRALPRIVAGLAALGVQSDKGASRQQASGPSASSPPPSSVQLEASFDRESYRGDQDGEALMLVEARMNQRPGICADVALLLDVSASMDTPDRYPLLRQAVAAFIKKLSPDDRVAILRFSNGVDAVLEPTTGARAASQVERVLHRMDSSSRLFGGATNIAPALHESLKVLTGTARPQAVRRLYVLTDGEIHDGEDGRRALNAYPGQRIEVNAYGFGTEFDPVALKDLLRDQRGGSVKPICDEADVVNTFEHIANVAGRLVAREAVLSIEFAPHVVVGDAWVFRPQERYLGPVKGRRLVRELGSIEAARSYTLATELRLPAGPESSVDVATATLRWEDDAGKHQHSTVLRAARNHSKKDAARNRRVMAAQAILDRVRRPSDDSDDLAALHARRELALIENRDPRLIAAIDKEIATLSGSSSSRMTDADRLYLSSDVGTVEVLDRGAARQLPRSSEL